eukprot:2237333-Rhodomonas_salina.1
MTTVIPRIQRRSSNTSTGFHSSSNLGSLVQPQSDSPSASRQESRHMVAGHGEQGQSEHEPAAA